MRPRLGLAHLLNHKTEAHRNQYELSKITEPNSGKSSIRIQGFWLDFCALSTLPQSTPQIFIHVSLTQSMLSISFSRAMTSTTSVTDTYLIGGLINFSQSTLSPFLGRPKLYYSFQKSAGGDLSGHTYYLQQVQFYLWYNLDWAQRLQTNLFFITSF